MDPSYQPARNMDKEQPPAVSLPLDLSLQTGSLPGTLPDERELRGREFPTWESFCTFIDAWCEQKKIVLIVREFVPLSKSDWTADLMSPEAAAALKFSYARLICREGRRSTKLEPRKGKKRCSSSIAVRLNQRNDGLVIAECKFVHNHLLCPIEFKHHFRKGHILEQTVRKPAKRGRKPSKGISQPAPMMHNSAQSMHNPQQSMPYPSQPAQPTSQAVHSPSKATHQPAPVIQHTSQAVQHPPETIQTTPEAVHHSRVMRRTTQAVRLSSQGMHQASQAMRQAAQAMRQASLANRQTSLAARSPSLAVRSPSLAVRSPSIAVRNPSIAVRNPSLAVRHASQAVRRNARAVRRNARPVRSSKKAAKQFLGDHDIRRLLASCKGRDLDLKDTFQALNGLFAGDPTSKVKVVFVKNNAIIQTVFFQTSLMRSLCQRFPETLIFDRMMGFNEEFALFTLLCVDANGRGRECAFCLARKGTPDLLRFTLLSLTQSIPEVTSKVGSVTVGVRVPEPGVVQEFLPSARVQICRLEVLGALLNKIQEIGSAQDEKSWPLLCDLASSSSPEAYTQTMERMEVSFSCDFMRYFHEHWHPCRKMWVACWGLETQQGTNTLIRQHQQKLVSGLSPSPTLGQCILDLVAMQTPKVDLECLNGEEVAACYRSVCNPEPARLIERELGIAGNGSYSIQGTDDGYTLGDGTSKFLLDQKLTTCSCLFHTSSQLPCRHLFVIRFRTGDTLFDVNLLQKNKSSLIKTLQQ
ncbi:uncharacterized protein ZSWIM9-like [Ambystoma mexicanum]|uniref:uncharacterized protein ZSWIM9-like n=1 Tax=Ambystoma mexicanum TaxID=8296 RepID=UPI0037E7BAFC